MTESFPTSFYDHLIQNTLTGIKAGSERSTFLDIWMVQVEGRVFARSWGKSTKSWFTTFLEQPEGEIKYGETILPISALPCTDEAMNLKINQAYLARYQTPENLPYAQGISQPEYAAYTMEFIPR
jgi:hypothetical protein